MEDVSKTTIAVLLILVVLISVIGTWVVLNTITTGFEQQTQQIIQPQNQEMLASNIVKSSQPVTGSGTVTLTVSKLSEEGE